MAVARFELVIAVCRRFVDGWIVLSVMEMMLAGITIIVTAKSADGGVVRQLRRRSLREAGSAARHLSTSALVSP